MTCMESHNVPSEGTSSVCPAKSHTRKLSDQPRIVRDDTAHEVASMYGEFTKRYVLSAPFDPSRVVVVRTDELETLK